MKSPVLIQVKSTIQRQKKTKHFLRFFFSEHTSPEIGEEEDSMQIAMGIKKHVILSGSLHSYRVILNIYH